MRLFIHRPFGTLLDFGDYLAQGTHQVQYVFTKFASIMKTIEASNSGTLEADKPCTTRMIAKVRRSAAHAFTLLLPILYTLPLFPSGKRREECSRLLLSQQRKTTMKYDELHP